MMDDIAIVAPTTHNDALKAMCDIPVDPYVGY